MPRLLNRSKYPRCDSSEDPLPLYFWPIIGRFYHHRVDRALNLLLGAEKHEGPSRVLEVGYGCGTSFLGLIDHFDEIHGLDTHDYGSAIKYTFAREGIKAHLTQGTILDPPYAPGYFDAILAISILEHLGPSDQARVMFQVNRLLRPGGIFVVGTPGVNRLMSVGFWMLGYDISKHHLSRPSQVREAAANVFTIERIMRLPAFGPDFFLLYEWFKARKITVANAGIGETNAARNP